MNINITPIEILEYYDIPLVFIGADIFNCSYLCMLVEEESLKYICIQISQPRINELISNAIDLRSCYTNPEHFVFFETTLSKDNETITITESEYKILPEEYLPEEGFLISSNNYNSALINDARKFNKPIIYLGIKDNNNSHAIPINKLGEILERYQSLVTNCFRKIDGKGSDMDSVLNAYDCSAASFNIHLYADSPLNLLETSRIDATLKTIDDLFKADNTETLKGKLVPLKGKTVQSFKNLLEYLYKNEYELKYRWTSDISNGEVISNNVSKLTIERDYNLLLENTELSKEIKYFECKFYAVNSDNGKWDITDLEGRTHSGITEDLDILSGIIIDNQFYKIKCEEIEKENNINIKNKTTLKLLECNVL